MFDPMMCKSPDVPLQDELLTRTSQLRTGQTSIGLLAIQVLHYKVDQHNVVFAVSWKIYMLDEIER